MLNDGVKDYTLKMVKRDTPLFWQVPGAGYLYRYNNYDYFTILNNNYQTYYGLQEYRKHNSLDDELDYFFTSQTKYKSAARMERELKNYLEKKYQAKNYSKQDYWKVIECIKLVKDRGGYFEAQKLINKYKIPDNYLRIKSFFFSQLGDIFKLAGNSSQAIINYKKMIDARFIVYQDDQYNNNYTRDLIIAYLKIADFYYYAGQLQDAGNYFKKALKLVRLLNKYEENLLYQELLAYNYKRLGDLLIEQNEGNEGIKYLSSALEIYKVVSRNSKESNKFTYSISHLYQAIIEYYSNTKNDSSVQNNEKRLMAYLKQEESRGNINAISVLTDISLDQGQLKEEKNDYEKALEYYLAANQKYKQVYNSEPDNLEYTLKFSSINSKIGRIYHLLQESGNAINYFKISFTIRQKISQFFTINTEDLIHLADDFEKAALILSNDNKLKAALDYYKDAYQAFTQIYSHNKEVKILTYRFLNIIDKLVEFYLKTGEADTALFFCREKYVVSKDLYMQNKNNYNDKRNFSITCNILGDIYFEKSGFNKALAFYKEALKIRELENKTLNTEEQENNPHNEEIQRDLTVSYNNLGDVYLKLNQIKKAASYYQKAFKIREVLYQDSNDLNKLLDLSHSYNKLGEIAFLRKNYKQALEYYKLDIKNCETLYNKNADNLEVNQALVVAYIKIADVYHKFKNYKTAFNYYNKALKITRTISKSYNQLWELQYQSGILYFKLGDNYYQQKKIKTAVTNYEKSLPILETAYKKDIKNTEYSNNLSKLYQRLGKVNYINNNYKTALEYYFKMIKLESKLLGIDNTKYYNLSFIYNKIGDIYYRLNNFKSAINYYKKSVLIREKLYENQQNNLNILNDLTICYNKLGTTYLQLKFYKLSQHYYKKELDIIEKIIAINKNHETMLIKATAIYNLGVVSKLMNDNISSDKYFKNAYSFLNEYKADKKVKNNPQFIALYSLLEEKIE